MPTIMADSGEVDSFNFRTRRRSRSLSDEAFFDSSPGAEPALAAESEKPEVRLRHPSCKSCLASACTLA